MPKLAACAPGTASAATNANLPGPALGRPGLAPPQHSVLHHLVHAAVVVGGGAVATLALFGCVLPMLDTLARPEAGHLFLRAVDASALPPPELEDLPEEPETLDEERPPRPLELTEAQPLDLAQLELVLAPGVSGTGTLGDATAWWSNAMGGSDSGGPSGAELFSAADLDKRPQVIYQPTPQLTAALRAAAPGTVHVIFVVGEDGTVETAKVQRSSDPIFNAPALAAVQRWRFVPGERQGKAVSFRMRVPMTFPAPR